MGETQRVGLVAEDAGRRFFDAFAERLDSLRRPGFGLLGLRQEVPPQQFAGGLEGPVEVLGARLPERVVELPGQQRLGGFRLLADILHLIDQFLVLLRCD